MCDSNYSSITNNLHTNCKRVKITDNIYYSVNLNQLTIKLHFNDYFITLSYTDLPTSFKTITKLYRFTYCRKDEKVSFISVIFRYQQTSIFFHHLVSEMIDFTNQYIQNFDFSMCCIQNDDSCFIYEILQFHNNSLSDMILYDLMTILNKICIELYTIILIYFNIKIN
ncbi:Uncharacterized protein FWK35_00030556, partial [Aphis craccivora]